MDPGEEGRGRGRSGLRSTKGKKIALSQTGWSRGEGLAGKKQDGGSGHAGKAGEDQSPWVTARDLACGHNDGEGNEHLILAVRCRGGTRWVLVHWRLADAGGAETMAARRTKLQ